MGLPIRTDHEQQQADDRRIGHAAIGPSGNSTVSIGDQLQILLDDWLIDSMPRLRLKLHHPRRAETVLRKDKPWEDSTMFDPVVIKDGSRYRMWYHTNFNSPPFYTGYAESDDGAHWTKPSLGLVEFRGEEEQQSGLIERT